MISHNFLFRIIKFWMYSYLRPMYLAMQRINNVCVKPMVRKIQQCYSICIKPVIRKAQRFCDVYVRPTIHKMRQFYNAYIHPVFLNIQQYCVANLRPPIQRVQRFCMDTYNKWFLPFYNNLTGSTDLILACKNGQAEVAMQLINAGADVNVKDIFKNTPLLYACSNSLSDVAIELINKGADINAMHTRSKNTVLILACRRGLTDVCRLLINKGADVNAKTRDGYTPLLFASMHNNGFDEIFNLLVDHGADVNATSSDGDYALWYSCWNNNLRQCTLLLNKGSKLNDTYKFGTIWHINPLGLSCFIENWDIARLLINHGADINVRSFGLYPLAFACMHGNMEIVRLLMDHGADIHNTGLKSNALHWACIDPTNIDVVRMLINEGINVEQKALLAITPLHVSCLFKNNCVSSVLINNSTNVDAKTLLNITPLPLACRSPSMNTSVTKLIDKGADINNINFLGTPLTIACENGFNPAVTELINAGASIDNCEFDDEPTIIKAVKGNINNDNIVALVRKGASVDPLLDDISIPLYKYIYSDNACIIYPATAHAVKEYLKMRTSELIFYSNIANVSTSAFVHASKIFADIFYTIDKAKKRIHTDICITHKFVTCIKQYQDIISAQLVFLIHISHSHSNKKYVEPIHHIRENNTEPRLTMG